MSGEVKSQAIEAVGVLVCITVKINRQAGVNGIGKYCGQYGLSKGNKSFRMVKSSCCQIIYEVPKLMTVN